MGPNDQIPRAPYKRLSAKYPQPLQARSKTPPKSLRDIVWDDKRGETRLPPESRKPPQPRWGWRLLAIALAAALGGWGAQLVYDHGLTGAIESASAAVQSVGKPFSSCLEGSRIRCFDRNWREIGDNLWQ
jgi:hypothetical protein